MRTTGHFDEAFNQRLTALFAIACEKLQEKGLLTDAIKSITVAVNPRMRSVAGWAKYAENKVELNYRLLSVDPTRLERTFNHEIAHLVAVATFGLGGRGHGRGWAKIMAILGYAPSRCHNYDTSELKHKRQKFAYSCPCGTKFQIGIVRHRKLVAGRRYFCKKCNGNLTPSI